MKKQILLFVSLFASLLCSAQYYNPYNTYQQNQQAFEWGQQLAEQMQQQQENQLKQNPVLMAGAMIQAIANYEDSKAYEYAEYLAENRGTAADWYWLGLLNEAGIYDYDIPYAKSCYREGASRRNGSICKARLADLEAGNEITEEMVRNHCMQIVVYGSSMTLPDFSSDNSSSSHRSSGSCPKCHGTRVDPSPCYENDPSGAQYAINQGLLGYQHVSSGRCPHCGKYNYHIHYKCYSSTYH